MFEIGIFCVILLAVGYWVALWLMGRHDDVLHGPFHPGRRGGGGCSQGIAAAHIIAQGPR
jgi:hypothetical protein